MCNKTYLKVFLYITNCLLNVKGALWIAYAMYALKPFLNRPFLGMSPATETLLLIQLLVYSILIFGVTSLVFGMIGIIATGEKNSPTLIVNSVFLMLLFLAELAVYIVLVVKKTGILIDSWQFWVLVVGAVLTLNTFSLTLSWNSYVKKSRYA